MGGAKEYIATVADVVEGDHGRYAVAYSDEISGSITFSVLPPVWNEKVKNIIGCLDDTPGNAAFEKLEPKPGDTVVLENVHMKNKKWRAERARYLTPPDVLSMLREEDIPYVKEVIKYLESYGLKIKFAGSVLKGDKKYNDIDLLASGNVIADAISGLINLPGTKTPLFPEKAADSSIYDVQFVSGDGFRYVNTFIDARFKISAGNTFIDVSFKRTGGFYSFTSIEDLMEELKKYRKVMKRYMGK